MEKKDEESAEDKTEEPSEERIKNAREEGNVANPKEISSTVSLLIFIFYFSLFYDKIINSFVSMIKNSFYLFLKKDYDFFILQDFFIFIISPVIIYFLPLFIFISVVPFLIGLFLTKFNFSLKKINFSFEKMNPLSGFKRIFGLHSLLEFGKIFLKLSCLSIIIIIFFKNNYNSIVENFNFSIKDFLFSLEKNIFNLFLLCSFFLLLFYFIEFIYQIFKIRRSLKMTKQEVKDDFKKQEGDPLVKSQRKKMGRNMILRKSLAQVSQANFIVTNPTHYSIAIKYVIGMKAPVVLAKGQDLIAFKIREIAKKNDIIIVENKSLARTLYSTVEIGQEIPNSLYQPVIEIIKYIYKIKGRRFFEKR